MTSEHVVNVRVYTCHSVDCAGEVSGMDKIPKPHGIAAICWACGSDLWTMPRFGADDASHIPNVKKPIVYPKPNVNWAAAWQQMFPTLGPADSERTIDEPST